MHCYWCNDNIVGWYIKYKGHTFCRKNNDACIKDFLYDEVDDALNIDYLPSQEDLMFDAAEFEEEIRKDLGGFYDKY